MSCIVYSKYDHIELPKTTIPTLTFQHIAIKSLASKANTTTLGR